MIATIYARKSTTQSGGGDITSGIPTHERRITWACSTNEARFLGGNAIVQVF